jgi:hypothetical protein
LGKGAEHQPFIDEKGVFDPTQILAFILTERWIRCILTTETAVLLGFFGLERVKGIEPSFQAWEAHVLPLNHTRAAWGILLAWAGAGRKLFAAVVVSFVRIGRTFCGQDGGRLDLGGEGIAIGSCAAG